MDQALQKAASQLTGEQHMRILTTIVCLAVSSAAFGDPIKERIRDTALQIFEEVRDASLSDSQARGMLSDLEGMLGTIRGNQPGGLICEPWSSNYAYVARADTGARIGDRVENATCQQIIAKSRVGLTCEPWSSNYAYVFDVAANSRLGDRVDFNTCYTILTASTRDLACSPWSSNYAYVHNRVLNRTLGDRVDHAMCSRILTNADRGLVCSPWSSNYAYLTRIADGSTIGDRVSFEQCFASIGQ
jgi:hypothetical protein